MCILEPSLFSGLSSSRVVSFLIGNILTHVTSLISNILTHAYKHAWYSETFTELD